MSKLQTKQDVIERYWPDYLDYCMEREGTRGHLCYNLPTLDGFWQWYITAGPMGVKHAGRFYSAVDRIEYV